MTSSSPSDLENCFTESQQTAESAESKPLPAFTSTPEDCKAPFEMNHGRFANKEAFMSYNQGYNEGYVQGYYCGMNTANIHHATIAQNRRFRGRGGFIRGGGHHHYFGNQQTAPNANQADAGEQQGQSKAFHLPPPYQQQHQQQQQVPYVRNQAFSNIYMQERKPRFQAFNNAADCSDFKSTV